MKKEGEKERGNTYYGVVSKFYHEIENEGRRRGGREKERGGGRRMGKGQRRRKNGREMTRRNKETKNQE